MKTLALISLLVSSIIEIFSSFDKKYAASLLGLCNEDTRLPLSKIKEETKKEVKSCLQELELL